MSITEIHQSGDPLPPVTFDTLVAAGVEHLLGWMQSTAGLGVAPTAKNARWLDVARMIVGLEANAGELAPAVGDALTLTDARAVADRVRCDAWCQITARWEDIT